MDWIPVNDLARCEDLHDGTLEAILAEVARCGYWVLGPRGAEFEAALSEVLSVPHVVGVANGTDALEIAIRALPDVRRPLVLTAANAGGYATTAIRNAGRRPAYADVDPLTHNLSANTVAQALNPGVGAVIVTHLYGRAAPVGEIREVCRARGIPVIEDCAQALGAFTPEGPVGSLGDLATLSFYPTKNLGAMGDGGAVACRDDELARRLRQLRQYGWSPKYVVQHDSGRNSRLDEVQAAVLAARLPRLAAWTSRRRAIVQSYAAQAGPRVHVLEAEDVAHAAHLAVVVVEDRAGLREHLHQRRIHSDVHYPVPDHRQPAWAQDYRDVALPVTERLADRVLTLPLFPQLTDGEVHRVGEALADF